MIQPQDHNVCRRYGCSVPVGDQQYLCAEHIVKLDDMLRRVPELIRDINPHDVTIKSGLSGSNGGGTDSGSRAPFNLHQWSVWLDLQHLPKRAHTVAYNDPGAGTVYAETRWVIAQADQILDPEDETPVDIRTARWRIHIEHPTPMTAAEIVHQFHDWGIEITRPQIRKWVEREHLMSVGTAEDGRSSLFTVLGILTAMERVAGEVAREEAHV